MKRKRDDDKHFTAPLSVVTRGPRADTPQRVRERTSEVTGATVQEPVVKPETQRVPVMQVDRTPETLHRGERRTLRTNDRRPYRVQTIILPEKPKKPRKEKP